MLNATPWCPDVWSCPAAPGAASRPVSGDAQCRRHARLRVHDMYASSAAQPARCARCKAGHAALQQQLQEARWFIKNIQQRFDTILRVSRAIVERQKGFFTHGELAMRPLVLREIADELGLHESTISRVTTAKYMATPFGTFELKYFFGSGLGTESGGNASSTAVRALIKQFIAAEDPHKPSATTRSPTCSRSRASTAPAAPWPSTAKGSRLPSRPCARRCSGALLRKHSMNQLQLFLPCAAGVEDLLAAEVHALTGLQGQDLLIRRGGVVAHTSWRDAMRLNLHSRLAQRVLVQLSHGEYRSEQDLYRAAHAVAWEIWFTPRQTIKVEVTAQHSPLQSLNFAALKIKDAVCDRFATWPQACAPASIPTGRMCASSRTSPPTPVRSTLTPRASRCSSAAGARTRAMRHSRKPWRRP